MKPKFSIVIALAPYRNAEVLSSLKKLDYDKRKYEVIIKKGYNPSENRNYGIKKAKGEIIAFIDQDNKLIGKNCLRELVYPLIKDTEIFGVACKLYVNKQDNIANRYLSYVGTDPFAVYRSVEGRMILDRINLNDNGRYHTYDINLENCLCTGGNVFLVRKDLLKKINGYVQDVEMIYSLCLMGINKLAIPKNAFTHHLTINSFKEFLKKRWYWAMHYNKKNIYKRNYSWFPRTFYEFIIFSLFMFSNLIIIPNLIDAIIKLIYTRDKAWLLHPISMFLITWIYIIVFIINHNS